MIIICNKWIDIKNNSIEDKIQNNILTNVRSFTKIENDNNGVSYF